MRVFEIKVPNFIYKMVNNLIVITVGRRVYFQAAPIS